VDSLLESSLADPDARRHAKLGALHYDLPIARRRFLTNRAAERPLPSFSIYFQWYVGERIKTEEERRARR
jgi:hypothetical protein